MFNAFILFILFYYYYYYFIYYLFYLTLCAFMFKHLKLFFSGRFLLLQKGRCHVSIKMYMHCLVHQFV